MTGDLRSLLSLQAGLSVLVLTLLWLLETWLPLVTDRRDRVRHAGSNLSLAAVNLAVVGLGFAGATAAVAAWAERARFGILHRLDAPGWMELGLALLLFDFWMYLWHRANHVVPFLWRFHRVHHSDRAVDASTALRFHFGEITFSSALRLGVIPLLGLTVQQVILYETLLLPVIAFHHSNVALPERWDRWLRTVIVSPGMHHVHHSDRQSETDSNFSSIFSWWDRLGRTILRREDVGALQYGLREFADERWQSVWGLVRMPLAARPRTARPRRCHALSEGAALAGGERGDGAFDSQGRANGERADRSEDGAAARAV